MLNMLNQFYNYIVNLLVDFFETEQLNIGERFYLAFDSQDDIDAFANAIKEYSNDKEFKYDVLNGKEYKTPVISINEIDLICSNTSEYVSSDFLVTLRNGVSEQEGVFTNSALLMIISKDLDSIIGGSSDLQKQGMPLNATYIANKLEMKIDKSTLSKNDKIVLKYKLSKILDEFQMNQLTFFDFEQIFTILMKEELEDSDYKKLGLFRDYELSTTYNKHEQRLNNNSEYFELVKKAHGYGDVNEELANKFTEQGVKKLSSDEWESLTYAEVERFRSEYENQKKRKKVSLNTVNDQEGIEFIERSESSTAAGKRKNHMLIFNENKSEKIQFKINVDTSKNVEHLKKEYIKVTNNKEHIEVSIKGKQLVVTLSCVDPEAEDYFSFEYYHETSKTLGGKYFVAVLPFEKEYLQRFTSKFLVNPKRKLLKLLPESLSDIKIGSFGSGNNNKEVLLEQQNQMIELNSLEVININLGEEVMQADDIIFSLKIREAIVKIMLDANESVKTPIDGKRLWRKIRENQEDIIWNIEQDELYISNQTYSLNSEYKNFFEFENQFINYNYKAAVIKAEQLIPEDIELSVNLREAFSRFINHFIVNKTIPSLSTVNSDWKSRANEYISEYLAAIDEVKEKNITGKPRVDLFKLGTVRTSTGLYLTPFHPLIVAYKLKYFEIVKRESIDTIILEQLIPESLVPFIYDFYDAGSGQNMILKPDYRMDAFEWIEYKPVTEVTISDANQYLAKVIKDKLKQFNAHFEYLFNSHIKAPIKINVINITNDQEVFKGLLEWMIQYIEKHGANKLFPIEISLYSYHKTVSEFDHFIKMGSVDEFVERYPLNIEKRGIDAEVIFNELQKNILYYKNDLNFVNKDEDIKYAHISFYKMDNKESDALHEMNNLSTGLSIEGLVSSLSVKDTNDCYETGFGSKYIDIDTENNLFKITCKVNEMAANIINGGNNSYRANESIYSRTSEVNEKLLEIITENSFWTTLVDPTIDLSYFSNNREKFYVIHYSDQYSTGNRYDAITITNKTKQYLEVVKEFLESKNVQASEEQLKDVVTSFNVFNGEWLLEIIGSAGHRDREKLSIISGIKYALAHLDHENITWVPISLEEILRVAGSSNLSKNNGVFSAKNLGSTGTISDDILFIGIEEGEEKLKLHYYPIEVKIGFNPTTVISKAKEQIDKVTELLHNNLSNNGTFTNRFYRNFFARLLISTANKLKKADFWPEKNYQLSDHVLNSLINENYDISRKLEPIIGKGAVLSFKKESYIKEKELTNNVLYLTLLEDDGYYGLIQSIKVLSKNLRQGRSDFVKEELLYYNYKTDVLAEEQIIDHHAKEERHSNDHSFDIEEEHVDSIINAEESDITKENNKETIEKVVSLETIQEEDHSDLEQTRLLIGTVENTNQKIYWEFGHRQLSNRHLLISGKSGQGKTYFMQCLLLEKAKRGISSVIIDYTEGFLPNQLESEFTSYLGDKITNRIVYNEKFPINPFAKNVRDLGGIELPEMNVDVAERVKSVFESVYSSLGIQQLNAIYQATMDGLDRYEENMSLKYLEVCLEEQGSTYAKTALSQIKPLIDRDPFQSKETINWSDIFNDRGEVYIIQLTNFTRQVQLIITEFILWDLWNYSLKHGEKNKPLPVILDEAQNLDHRENSPSGRILTEGRKFGWSGWYATQFLKSQLDSAELSRLQNSGEKIYFAAPDQEIANIAASLANDRSERYEWEQKLRRLKKGQCIVNGPIRTENGDLSTTQSIIVNISPLSERI